jgi:hypothetical protein
MFLNRKMKCTQSSGKNKESHRREVMAPSDSYWFDENLETMCGMLPGKNGLKRESLKEFLGLLDIQQVGFKMSTCEVMAD